ncbi:MAG: fructosamine kinase family protein [Rhodospirillaceae bacterium]
MRADIADLIERVTGRRPSAMRPLSGGCVADVVRVSLAGGGDVVAKLGDAGSGLALEGFMLEYLAAHSGLPVPAVLHASDAMLLLEYLPSDGRIDGKAEIHAANLVAALHDVTTERFGFGRDTVIGGLAQPNPWTESWRDFFRDRRLLHMAGEATAAGRLPAATMHRIDRLAGRLPEWIDDGAAPSLVHGDMWGGNVLVVEGRVTGFIDPAIHYADAEIELAFTTLFNTFSDTFFARYREHRAIRPGFFEARRDLYNLYPLLVHVRLFGGSYVGSVGRTLERFGC